MQALAAVNIAEKRVETQVFPSLAMEKKRRRSDPSLHVSEDATTASKQRKRKSDTDSVAADLSIDIRQTGISSEPDLPIEEEEKLEKESDGLEDYWKDFALAIESGKLDTVDEAANEKEDNEKTEDIDCNHDIRIHDDLGHVCRICGMIVRRAESIIDYQWKKPSRRRTSSYGGHSKDADDTDCGGVKLYEDFMFADIAIHPRHAKKMRPHQLEGFKFLVKNLTGDKPGVDQFNNSADAKVLFGSIKACGEGISIVGASRVVILDVHLNPAVTRQAIGRAFRPGQQKEVFVYRLIAADSAEEKHHETAFKKEVIQKLWFEWSEHCTTEDFKLDQVDIDDSMDELLDTKAMSQDIKALYKR
nr:unnamed protein product [Digitaria exilis]